MVVELWRSQRSGMPAWAEGVVREARRGGLWALEPGFDGVFTLQPVRIACQLESLQECPPKCVPRRIVQCPCRGRSYAVNF